MKRLFSVILLLAFGSMCLQAQNPGKGNIHLINTPLANAIEFYAQISQRTVLHGALPPVLITVEENGLAKDQAAAAFEKAFSKQHLTCIPDGKKLVLLVPDREVGRAKALLATNPCPKEETPKPTPQAPFPEGTVHFPATPVDMVIPVYRELVGAKGFDPNPAFPLPPVQISLKTQTSLSRSEAIHALDIVLGLNGIKHERTAGNKLTAAPAVLK